MESTKVSFEDTSIAFSSKSNLQLKKIYLLFASMNQNWLVKLGTFFIKLFIFLHFPIKKLIRVTVFEQFCGGETLQECNKTIENLDKSHIGTILDYSVEGEDNEKSFDKTTQEVLLTIEKAYENIAIPFAVFKVTGIASMDLLEKIQNEEELNNDEKAAFERVRERMNILCGRAHALNVRIFVDAEESWIQDTIDTLTYGMMEKYNQEQCIVYNTFQMYRKDMLQNLKEATQQARDNHFSLGVKLVRGAYMEKERQRSHEENYCEPVHETKAATDHDYNLGVVFCVENRDNISLCVGTHNEFSCKQLVDLMQKNQIDPTDKHFYFAQLLGMSDNISYNLSKAGYNVAKYVPYGPIEAVMPYLFRRAAENTSVSGQASREFVLIKREIVRRKRLMFTKK
ncbi:MULTISPECIES: proline dehydrogenase family protein [Arcicella]|uniref:Proline dehydrogenase family protein n=1 Tax=Arcicella aquatica TaxID=217141 RepID=A0ABU5QSB5_9BACT|nr:MULTISPECIES: proline dehydrogenase family protein [Arcicella]MDR6563167.1 proline dehydrogenase [Arcicella sp. BE51]MDR6811682.1 proline dehydrogenase [Arcicella sp. BE140]MDR6823207.1 proline dehydrogenase [Arcicella sp. BE139]MEA5259976.1 proline dehydrogenase family protein [Arcicella aquatica]